MDDAETIRQKRLARLGGSTSQSTKEPIKKPVQPVPTQPLILQPEIKTKQPDTLNKVLIQPTVIPAEKKVLSPCEVFMSQTDEQWLHEMVLTIMKLTLDENDTSGRVYLKKMVRDLNREKLPLIVTAEHFEKVIYLRLSMEENKRADWEASFDYMVNCWLRLDSLICEMQMWRFNTDMSLTVNRRVDIAKKLHNIFLNYCGLLINQDCVDLFPLNHDLYSAYWGHRLATVPNPEAIYPRLFVQAFINRYLNDNLMTFFTNTIKAMMTVMRSRHLYDGFESVYTGLEYLLSFKVFAEMSHELFNWSPKYANAPSIEVTSFLGPFFSRVTTFPDTDSELHNRYFPAGPMVTDAIFDDATGVGSRNYSDCRQSKTLMRDTINWAREHLHRIVFAIIKTGPKGRDDVLDYLAKLIRLNEKRAQTHSQRDQVSSDGFMLNWNQIAKKLCDPFTDANYSKLHLIDMEYFFKTTRLDITGETRINADLEYAKEVLEKYKVEHPTPDSPNFISEIFFLTLAYQHYAHITTIRFYNRFIRELDDMQRNGKRHVQARDSGAWSHLEEATRNANEQGVIRLQAELDKLFGYKLAMEAGLMDGQLIDQTVRFYNLTIAWLLKCASGDRNEHTPWTKVIRGESDAIPLFPLTSSRPEFQTLPEYILEDMFDFFIFVLKHSANSVEGNARDELTTFALVLLYNNTLVKNPYLKAKIVEILWLFSAPQFYSHTGHTIVRIDNAFIMHKWAKEYMVHVLVRFYIDIEQTGRSSQFYDKFNTRYNISQTMRNLLQKDEHKKKLHELAATHPDMFIQFAALLNNDITYLMDEAMGKIAEIASIQRQIDQDDGMDQSSAAVQLRMEREQNLSGHERNAQTYTSLSKEALLFLTLLTEFKNVRVAFLSQEIVGRFTAMLDFNIVRLSGPKCVELKVKNAQKYFFDPKKLLSSLFDVYVHFGEDAQPFIEAIARDGRSFSKEIFVTAANIIGRFQLRDPTRIQKFMNIVNKAEKIAQRDLQEDEELGELPEEFTDPVMFTLMEEPVVLPSGIRVDLSTIRMHLLSDPHDPFNRQPLKLEDCVPDLELKERIRAWKEEKMSSRMQE